MFNIYQLNILRNERLNFIEIITEDTFLLKYLSTGQPRWRSGLAPPAAQGVILETPDRVPCRAPCMDPASPSACASASLSVFSLCILMNK